MRKLFLIVFALLVTVSLAQPQSFANHSFARGDKPDSSNQISWFPRLFNGVPSGSCSASDIGINTLTGILYSCNGGVWLQTAASGGAGLFSTLSSTLRFRDCRQDGTLDITGVADSSATINTCIANAVTNSQTEVVLPCGKLRINTTINLTNRPGIIFHGCGVQANVTNPPVGGVGITNLWCNTGGTCIETTGSKSLEIDHMIITLCCAADMGGSQPNASIIGILQGRDNTGGGGAANPFCFSEQQNFHDLYITDNGGGATAQNGGRGQIGIYNIGAENGVYSNIQILSGTDMMFSQTNAVGTTGVYQVISTGCPASMIGESFNNMTLVGSAITLPEVEANLTNSFTWNNLQGVGGKQVFKFENLSGAAVTSDWFVTGLAELLTTSVITTTVGLDNMHFFWLVQSAPPANIITVGANNLTLSNMQFWFGGLAGASTTSLIDNVATGTLIKGSIIQIIGTTSASNTVVTSSEIIAPFTTNANITFGAGSNYKLLSSSGLIVAGQELFGSGTATAPGMSFSQNATIGWFLDSNLSMQLGFNGAGPLFNGTQVGLGSAMAVTYTSGADPNNTAFDTAQSRSAAGVLSADTTAIGNGLGSYIASKYTTKTNCSSSAAPAVCGSAAAGSFVIAAAGTSVTVNTTAVTANSQIFVQEDESLGAKLGVTCNTGILANPPAITARTAATSFAVGITAGLAVNPVCFSYNIVN